MPVLELDAATGVRKDFVNDAFKFEDFFLRHVVSFVVSIVPSFVDAGRAVKTGIAGSV